MPTSNNSQTNVKNVVKIWFSGNFRGEIYDFVEKLGGLQFIFPLNRKKLGRKSTLVVKNTLLSKQEKKILSEK